MHNNDLHTEIEKAMGPLFTCTKHGDYHRIRTPYLYPDGDNIDLFYKSGDDTVIVTDLAETAGWLRVQSMSLRRSPKQNQLIEDACVTHGVEFYRGMLQVRCRPEDSLSATVTRLAKAVLWISEQRFSRSAESMTDTVAD